MGQSNYKNELRVIGGRWRSRKIRFPDADGLRPTANRIRETLFNWLQFRIEGKRCLDLFAGSGACGIEALSRGASEVVFVENSPESARAIRENLEQLEGNGIVHCADALSWLRTPRNDDRGFAIVFMDPPYTANLEILCCALLEQSGRLLPGSLVYLESDKDLPAGEFPSNWRRLKHAKAGLVYYSLFERTSEKRPGTP